MVLEYYLEKLKNIDSLILPKRAVWARQVYHLFVIRSKKRDLLQEHLKTYSISTGVHYPIALPKLKAYAYIPQESVKFFANSIDDELLSLPIGDHLDQDDLEKIVRVIKEFE